MCALSIKVPIRKKSGNLSYAPGILLVLCHNLAKFTELLSRKYKVGTTTHHRLLKE